MTSNRRVTPHAGVWIETLEVKHTTKHEDVTPHAGVWIETQINSYKNSYQCHSPRGSVD